MSSRLFLPHPIELEGRKATIWGPTEKVRIAFPGLDPDDIPAPVVKTVTVKASVQHRRYPGGPLITRKGHTRKYESRSGIEQGTSPGRAFWVVVPAGPVPGSKPKTMQFTYLGSFMVIRKFARAEMPEGFRLKSSTGRSETIER